MHGQFTTVRGHEGWNDILRVNVINHALGPANRNKKVVRASKYSGRMPETHQLMLEAWSMEEEGPVVSMFVRKV